MELRAIVAAMAASGCLFLATNETARAVDEIDTIVLTKLNTGGRLGTHLYGFGTTPRVADRIVSLYVYVTSVDSLQEMLFEPVGTRTGEEKYYSFANCGNKEEKKHFKDAFTKQKTTEIAFTQTVHTSTSFHGKMSFNGEYFWGKIGTEVEGSTTKDLSFTDSNKRIASETTAKEEEFDFVAPPRTLVIYRAATMGGTKKVKFSGTVVVNGVYHYHIADIWDQNGNIEDVLKEEKERTFPFSGFLTTVNLTKITLERYERPLSIKTCKDKAALAEELGGRFTTIDPKDARREKLKAKEIKTIQCDFVSHSAICKF